MGHINKAKAFELSAGNVSVFGEFSEKLKNNKKAAALGTTPLALILSACGGGSSSTTSSNVLTLTKSADTYSASAVTGFTVADSSTAKFDVADASSNAYEIKLDATGTGVLEFDFVDAGDTVTLAAGSKTSGFTTLKVTDGTLDATNADLTGITRVEVASGIKISLAQIKEIPTIVANSATSEITVEVTTEAEATELVSLISAGTVKVFADTNPIKLVAAPAATIATETLETKQTETTASVKPAAEAPADTSATDTTTDTDTSTGTDDTTTDTGTTTGGTTGGGGGGGTDTPIFGLIQSSPGTYIVGTLNGNVTATDNGDLVNFKPASGVSVDVLDSAVTGLRVDDITLTTTATYADGKTITGNGNITLTALNGDAAADLSNITASGTKTVNVADDVTFTGDLGSFAVTVDSGKTLTTTAAKATGLTMTGAGGVTLTALDADADADLSNITVSGTKTANVADDVTFTGDLGSFAVTVDASKTLTTTAAKVTGLAITGSGTVAISDLATMTGDLDVSSITATVDIDNAAIDSTKTLTATATQAATKTITGAGNVTLSALNADADADLSNITASGTLAVNVADDVTFTGDLGTFAVSVDSGKTLTTTAAKITGLAVTGSGTVAISDLGTMTGDLNVSGISATVDIDNAAIDSAKTLTATAAQATGKTITGAGSVTISAVDATAAADLSSISASGTLAAAVSDDVTFTGNFGTFAVSVASGKTLTTTALKATGLTMSGSGGVTLTALDADADADLSNIAVSGTKTANVADNVTFTGNLGTFAVTVDTSKTLTTTAAKADGIAITGAGGVTLTALEGDLAADLSNITASGTLAATIDTDTGVTYTGDMGTFAVTLTSSDAGAGDTLTVSAANASGNTFTASTSNEAVIITGSSGDQTLSGTANADTITGGAGSDTITAGLGADTIMISDDNGSDIINGFVVGTDLINFTGVTATGSLAKVAKTNSGDISFTVDGSNTTVYVINTDAQDLDGATTNASPIDFSDITSVGAFLNAGVTSSNASGEVHYFVINDGDVSTKSYMYKFVDDGADTAVDADGSELSLIATITTDAALTTTEIVIS